MGVRVKKKLGGEKMLKGFEKSLNVACTNGKLATLRHFVFGDLVGRCVIKFVHRFDFIHKYPCMQG